MNLMRKTPFFYIVFLLLIGLGLFLFHDRFSEQAGQSRKIINESEMAANETLPKLSFAKAHPSQPETYSPKTDDQETSAEGVKEASELLLKEDVDKMKLICGLTKSQTDEVRKRLTEIRINQEELVFGAETEALAKLLSPEQLKAWKNFLEQERIESAEHFAVLTLRSVSRAVIDLTPEQKGQLFEKFVDVALNDQQSDEEVLKIILTGEQFSRWTAEEAKEHDL